MMLIMDKGGGSIVGSIDTKRWLKLPRHSLKGTLIKLMQIMLEIWMPIDPVLQCGDFSGLCMHVHARMQW